MSRLEFYSRFIESGKFKGLPRGSPFCCGEFGAHTRLFREEPENGENHEPCGHNDFHESNGTRQSDDHYNQPSESESEFAHTPP
jgi:hypothetical protein